MRDILLARPERVAGIGPSQAGRLRSSVGGRRAALVEIAGRDSIAAGVAAARSGAYELLIPTIAYTGTEHGDWERVLENAGTLAELTAGIPGVEVLPEAALTGSPMWWHASAGRYAGLLARRYGFSTLCVACHMYLHALRVPLAKATGALAVVSGERLSHDGRVKINQLAPVLDTYVSVLAARGIELDLPLRDVGEGTVIEELVGPWPESARQMSCVLESNYREPDGTVRLEHGSLEAYLSEFLVPFTESVLRVAGEGAEPDYEQIAARTVRDWSKA